MDKKVGVIIGSVAAVVIVIFLISFFALRGRAEDIAFLSIENGDVQVNSGSGWEQASDGMALSLNDMIKTGDDGEASVIIYDSAIISLSPNTEVMIADLADDTATVKQNSGSTWNKFIGLSGLKGLEIETPTAVATVRGTEFGIDLTGEEDVSESLIVAEGEVMFGLKEARQEMMSAKKGEKLVLLREMKAAGAQPDEADKASAAMPAPQEAGGKIMQRIEKRELDANDKEKMIEGVVKSIDRMKKVREVQLEKHPELRMRILAMQDTEQRAVESAPAGEKALQLKDFKAEMKEGIEQKLDRLASLRPELIAKIQERAEAGDENARKILMLKRAMENAGMENVNKVNTKIIEQVKLLEELQQSTDKEMQAKVGQVLEKPAFKQIIEPLAEADQMTREQMIRNRIMSQEEMENIQEYRPIQQIIERPIVVAPPPEDNMQTEPVNPKPIVVEKPAIESNTNTENNNTINQITNQNTLKN
ncbi:MAG: FecR domain-containing protein [Nanoarchaeota archaeon]|nr:FecR domain-containing protein [Nanoarchaeota archaeon]